MSNTAAAAQTSTDKPAEEAAPQQQKRAALEEDDEFEDFPIEGMLSLITTISAVLAYTFRPMSTKKANMIHLADWPQEDAEVPEASSSGNVNGNSDHLWEESWDDDDTNEDFSKQLKYTSLSLPFPRLLYIYFALRSRAC